MSLRPKIKTSDQTKNHTPQHQHRPGRNNLPPRQDRSKTKINEAGYEEQCNIPKIKRRKFNKSADFRREGLGKKNLGHTSAKIS